MLTRFLPHSDEDAAFCVLVVENLEEGFAEVAQWVRGALGTQAAAVLDVLVDESQVPAGALDALHGLHPSEPWVQVRSPGCNPSFAGVPTASVTFTAVTWDTVVDGVPLDPRSVEREWTIEACPPGRDPEVHEVAVTLLWDASDQGCYLEDEEALRLARAIVSTGIAHPGAPASRSPA